jgi:ribosomal protein S18 acetylase RimI-like enzyme
MRYVRPPKSGKAVHFTRAVHPSLLDAPGQGVDAMWRGQIGLWLGRSRRIGFFSGIYGRGRMFAGNMARIVQALAVAEIELVKSLFREYADSLGVDLCFQSFDRELSELPGDYAPPRGRLFLIYGSVSKDEERIAGCGALRPLSGEICEMKRLYVRPEFRGLGIGRALAEALADAAREIGYRAMRLDTLPAMREAQGLYFAMGFQEIDAYTHNPVSGSRFLELDLTRDSFRKENT